MARIYVIDDDEQLLRMVGLMLERGGHAVTLINNPVDGLERIKTTKPDLLVVDVMMPNMSGHDIARQVRGTKSIEDLPILMLTARSQDIDREAALKSGANDYLSKPVTSQELIEHVDNLLTKRSDKETAGEHMVIAFFGLRGGVGQSTLAVNLAGALRRLSQQDVCLIDLSPSGGQVAMHLRLQPRATWADLTEEQHLEWETIKARLTVHASGLRVLAAPIAPQQPDLLTGSKTTAILDLVKENSVFTILDLPNVLNESFIVGLQAADIALHIVAPEMVSVQTATQINRVLPKMGVAFKQKSYILNQVTAEPALPQATVERALNGRIAFNVGYDSNQARALAQGAPLTLSQNKSPLSTVISRMAEVIWQRVSKKSA